MAAKVVLQDCFDSRKPRLLLMNIDHGAVWLVFRCVVSYFIAHTVDGFPTPHDCRHDGKCIPISGGSASDAESISAYNWMAENFVEADFMGVTTGQHGGFSFEPTFPLYQKQARAGYQSVH